MNLVDLFTQLLPNIAILKQDDNSPSGPYFAFSTQSQYPYNENSSDDCADDNIVCPKWVTVHKDRNSTLLSIRFLATMKWSEIGKYVRSEQLVDLSAPNSLDELKSVCNWLSEPLTDSELEPLKDPDPYYDYY